MRHIKSFYYYLLLWVSVSMHACDPVPIVMGLHLVALRALRATLKQTKPSYRNTILIVYFVQTHLFTEKLGAMG